MSEEFACPVCDSPAIVYPEEGEEDRVVCGGCGAFVATRDQFRRLVDNTQRCRPADARLDSEA
jgi:hypothetical protein